MIRKIIKFLIILIISALIGNMAYGMYKEMQISDAPSNSSNNVENANEENQNYDAIKTGTEDSKNEIEKNTDNSSKIGKELDEPITSEYKGYKVSSKLIIPKIDLETYVFQEYDEEAMWICPTKYYGPNPNEVGNYVIAAHNYDKQNMFNHIIELEAGDEIYLQDNKNGELEYEVYDIYKAKPEDTSSLSQETDGNVELTLITCSDYSSTRIIVKARTMGTEHSFEILNKGDTPQ